jgi:HK97 family phage portal protein
VGRFADAARKTAIGYPAPGWGPPGVGSLSSTLISGVPITQDMALGVLAFTAGVRLIAEDIASLPLITYKRLDKGKERAPNHPAYALLHDSPNPEMTAMVWRETGVGHMYTWGNWYAEKELNGYGVPVRLWPLRPDRMIKVEMKGGKRVYTYRLPDGSTEELPARNIFHVPGFGFDGLVGYSRLTLMRRAIEAAMAVEEYGLRTFAQGARPGVTILSKNQLSKDAKRNIVDSWDENHKGLSNAQRTAILDEGMELDQIGFPPEDAQFLESRRFSVEEMARGLRLSPHKLSDYSRATFSNIEESNIDHVVGTLRPVAVRIEQQLNKDIIGDPVYFAEHLFDALLRGKTLERAQANQIRIQSGTLSPDEAREMENQNPIADGSGDTYLAPLNMTPLDMLANAVASRTNTPAEPNPADTLLAALTAFVLKDQQPPVTFGPGSIKVDTHSAPITVSPAEVNVTIEKGATQVDNHVTPGSVNVAPAAVNVTVPEPAKTRKVLTRDDKGRITGSIEEPTA